MRKPVGEWMVRCAYVLFFALLGFAAADYGLTRNASHLRFQFLTAGVFGLWLIGCAIAGRWPRTGWVVWLPIIGLGVIGYGKAAAAGFFDHQLAILSDIGIQVITQPDSFLAVLSRLASVNAEASWRVTGTAMALLAGFLMAIEIWRNRLWSRALLLWMISIGLSITILFFLQKTMGGPFQLLNVGGRPTSFFVYNYWGNAAAFLNLFWPVALGVAIFSAIQKSFFWSVWLLPPLMMFAAVFINISKAGNILALAGLVVFVALIALPLVRMIRNFDVRIRKSYILAMIIPVVVIGISCYFAMPWKRWDYYLSRSEGVQSDTRYRAYVQFMQMIPDAGWSGFGPGTFEGIHLDYFQGHPKLLRSAFWTAHQDYIQTTVEWGWIGAALWAIIIIPGGGFILILLFKKSRYPSLPRQHYGWGIWDPLRRFFLALPDRDQPLLLAGIATSIALVAIHAAIDFPFQVPSIGLYFLIWIALGWSLMGGTSESMDDDD